MIGQFTKDTLLILRQHPLFKAVTKLKKRVTKCKKHPKYKVIRKPRSGCKTCEQLWKQKQNKKSPKRQKLPQAPSAARKYVWVDEPRPKGKIIKKKKRRK